MSKGYQGSEVVLSPEALRLATQGGQEAARAARHERHSKSPLEGAGDEEKRCQFDGSKLTSEKKSFMLPVRPARCNEEARWSVQLDYHDPKSPYTALCTNHFLMLPVNPSGKVYRVWRIK